MCPSPSPRSPNQECKKGSGPESENSEGLEEEGTLLRMGFKRADVSKLFRRSEPVNNLLNSKGEKGQY